MQWLLQLHMLKLHIVLLPHLPLHPLVLQCLLLGFLLFRAKILAVGSPESDVNRSDLWCPSLLLPARLVLPSNEHSAADLAGFSSASLAAASVSCFTDRPAATAISDVPPVHGSVMFLLVMLPLPR